MTLQKQRGVLLVNLGTPSSFKPKSIRRYLYQFLSDRRVVDLPKWRWWPILVSIVLPIRAKRLSRLYQSIWLEKGSPLLVYSQQLQCGLNKALPAGTHVELAMSYGSPSIDSALEALMRKGITELLVLPLYPQYSSSTTAAVWDGIHHFFAKKRNLPQITFIRDYAEQPEYIAALANSIEAASMQYGKPDFIVFSYHGIPLRYHNEGDDYSTRCKATTDAVVKQLNISEGNYAIAYQSRFGKEEWLSPDVVPLLQTLPHQGMKHVQILCPGFAVDCLETLEEIACTNQRLFFAAGGERYHYIPALNATDSQIKALAAVINQIEP